MNLKMFAACEWKSGQSGEIEGYGSVFDVTDRGGDVVKPGAFQKSLSSGRRVAMLYQHDASRVIGVWNSIAEDAHGLRVKGRLLLDTPDGATAYAQIKAGAIDGLSIGYRTVKAVEGADYTREILEAELWEVSVVTFPMNEPAKVDSVKAQGMTKREMEEALVRGMPLSRSVAQALMRDGFKGLDAMRDAGPTLSELTEAMRAKVDLKTSFMRG